MQQIMLHSSVCCGIRERTLSKVLSQYGIFEHQIRFLLQYDTLKIHGLSINSMF